MAKPSRLEFPLPYVLTNFSCSLFARNLKKKVIDLDVKNFVKSLQVIWRWSFFKVLLFIIFRIFLACYVISCVKCQIEIKIYMYVVSIFKSLKIFNSFFQFTQLPVKKDGFILCTVLRIPPNTGKPIFIL